MFPFLEYENNEIKINPFLTFQFSKPRLKTRKGCVLCILNIVIIFIYIVCIKQIKT